MYLIKTCPQSSSANQNIKTCPQSSSANIKTSKHVRNRAVPICENWTEIYAGVNGSHHQFLLHNTNFHSFSTLQLPWVLIWIHFQTLARLTQCQTTVIWVMSAASFRSTTVTVIWTPTVTRKWSFTVWKISRPKSILYWTTTVMNRLLTWSQSRTPTRNQKATQLRTPKWSCAVRKNNQLKLFLCWTMTTSAISQLTLTRTLT